MMWKVVDIGITLVGQSAQIELPELSAPETPPDIKKLLEN